MTLEHFDSIFAFVVVIAGVSLLVTMLAQMVAALLGLRGTHLQWGLKTLFESLDSRLKKHADKISSAVLHHPLISDSTFSTLNQDDAGGLKAIFRWLRNKFLCRWKLATAIRKDELHRILLLLATSPPSATVTSPPDWSALLTSPPETSLPENWQIELANALERFQPEAARVFQLVRPELEKFFPHDAAKANELLAKATNAIGDLSHEIETWFDSIMDRVSQRFALHMRLWTVLFSIVIAFALQLNSFRLFQQISNDAELRASLVASAQGLTKKADEILATGINAPAAVYIEAMKQLCSLHAGQLTNAPGGFSDFDGGNRWLTNELKTAGITNSEPYLRQYGALVPGAKLSVAADNLHSILNDKMKFQIIPDDYPKSPEAFLAATGKHFLGIAASAALLSLGAPFWFNMLKSLANLRPILANKEEKKAKT